MEKSNSLYNDGMMPLMYSELKAQQEKIGWHRVGHNICYYKNQYVTNFKLHNKSKYYYTFTFVTTFPFENDICFFAPAYPYSFTRLQVFVKKKN